MAAKIGLPIIVNMEGAASFGGPHLWTKWHERPAEPRTRSCPKRCRSKTCGPTRDGAESAAKNPHPHQSQPGGRREYDNTPSRIILSPSSPTKTGSVFDAGRRARPTYPHYWYREYDLDLGRSQGNIQFGEKIWSRELITPWCSSIQARRPNPILRCRTVTAMSTAGLSVTRHA